MLARIDRQKIDLRRMAMQCLHKQDNFFYGNILLVHIGTHEEARRRRLFK